jgi:transcriptional regulator with XRE-family HTH domain
VLTEAELRKYQAARTHQRAHSPPHPICVLLRQLRRAANLTLTDFENKHGIPSVVVGAYERGDRLPPLPKLDALLACYGYALTAVPTGSNAVRLPGDIVSDLRAIANQLETSHDVSSVSDSAA